jgi:hypothetical protein
VRTSSFAATALLVGAGVMQAQVPGAAAKAAARSAVAATNAHIEAEQSVDQQKPAAKSPAPKAPASKAPASKAPAPASAAPKTVERPAPRLEIAGVDTAGTPPIILRETYAFAKDGRRDPFVSLLTTNELRPTMSDLRLTGILYDQGAGHSVATLRDIATNVSYRVTAGTALGRMRVSAIRLKTILFTIDEFGATRQDSLVLGDSTKVRGK